MKKTGKRISAIIMAAVLLLTMAGFVSKPEAAFAAVNPETTFAVKPEAIRSIEQVPLGWWAIQAKVNLRTTQGTGSHAKIVMYSDSASISIGVQYDAECKNAEYRGIPSILVENVLNNTSDGKKQKRVAPTQRDKDIQIMIVRKKNSPTFYVYANGGYIGPVTNSAIGNRPVVLGVAASAKKGGDALNAVFKNVSLKYPKEPFANSGKTPKPVQKNPGFNIDLTKYHIEPGRKRNITISGTLQLPGGKDWDSANGDCSGIVQFIR